MSHMRVTDQESSKSSHLSALLPAAVAGTTSIAVYVLLKLQGAAVWTSYEGLYHTYRHSGLSLESQTSALMVVAIAQHTEPCVYEIHGLHL